MAIELVGAVGVEPTTNGLKVSLSAFSLFGINDLRSGCSVQLRLFGLIWSVLRTFSVPFSLGFLRLAYSYNQFYSETNDCGISPFTTTQSRQQFKPPLYLRSFRYPLLAMFGEFRR